MDAHIRLSTFQVSSLKKGYYQLLLQQTTKLESQMEPLHSSQEIDLVMSTNRFTMDKSNVYTVYPPIECAGEFGTCLPHIVLKNASYPWNQGHQSADGEALIPGVAVFLFSEQDEQSDQLIEQVLPIHQVYQQQSAIYTPKQLMQDDCDNEDPAQECQVLDIPSALFCDLCPDEKEISLLCHVKEVSLDHKEHDQAIEEGVFSCVVANRFPMIAHNKDERIKHTAYLVSLAKHKDYQPVYEDVQQVKHKRFTHIRVIVLYKWSFYTTKEPYSFLSEIKKISPNVLYHSLDEEVYEDQELLNILKKGYYPLNHDIRDGSKSVSWYRGPLLPILLDTVTPKYHIFADELYYFDPEIGMFDVSYACAWRLGRMLSLQNLSICRELLLWRMKNCYAAAKQKQTNVILQQLLPSQQPHLMNAYTGEQYVDLKKELQSLSKELIAMLPSYEEPL